MYRFILLSILMLFNGILTAQEISQWRGENRDGHYPSEKLMAEWPTEGPAQLWQVDNLGHGYASATVGKDLIFVTGKKDSLEVLTAIKMNGEVAWTLNYGKAASQNGYPAARTTPTVQGDMLYLISGRGEVVCVDASQKKILWSVDGFNTFESKVGHWETAESPLIVDDKVIYTPAGHQTTVVALNKKTGETIWKSKSLGDTAAYVSPILVEYAGKKMIVTVTARYVLGVNAANGDLMWTFDYVAQDSPQGHPMAPFINCNSPVYHDGRIFVTSGYNHTGLQLQLNEDGSDVKMTWSAPTLDTHIGGVVLVDGYLYGSNWINNRAGNWVCLDWNTGEVQYEEEWFSKGSIVVAGDMLLCYEEKRGNLALVRPNPQSFEVVSSMPIELGDGPHWAHPVVHNGILYMRHGNAMMAYRIGAST